LSFHLSNEKKNLGQKYILGFSYKGYGPDFYLPYYTLIRQEARLIVLKLSDVVCCYKQQPKAGRNEKIEVADG